MTGFDEVVEYIAGYDPAFRASIEGASAVEIATLEALTKTELPPTYKGFLAAMGRKTGWIDIKSFDLRIDTVLAYYRRKDALPADQYLRIGTDLKDPSFDPYIRRSVLSEDPSIVTFPECTVKNVADVTAEFLRYFAGGLREMFSRPAFRIYEVFGPGRKPVAVRAKERGRDELEQLDELLLMEFGLEPVFWSNESARGYSSAEIAVEAEQLGFYPLEVLVRADDPAKQKRLARMVAERFGAEIGVPAV
jgi:hypothetical protein